jgi:homoserine O-acetyltransferase
MDAILPIACQPVQISGRNLLWRRLIREAIRTDPDFPDGNDLTSFSRFKRLMPIYDIMTESPLRLQDGGKTGDEAEQLYDKLISNYTSFAALDVLYWFESSFDYDPKPKLHEIKARVLAVNFADDEVNPTELGVMEREMPHVKHGRFVTVPAGPETHGHLTLLRAKLWKRHILELLH